MGTFHAPPVNRITPVGPPNAYLTYQVAAPVGSHFRPATCAEVGCPHYLRGWATSVLPGSRDEALIRRSGRKYVTAEPAPDGFVRYTFEAGQQCFAASRHKLPVGRPPVCLVRDGDWRGNPTGRIRRHANIRDWAEDFAENQQRLVDEFNAG